jgi:cysteine synthase
MTSSPPRTLRRRTAPDRSVPADPSPRSPRVITAPQAFDEADLYVDLRPVAGVPLYLKCEGFNFAGSIKLKAAKEMVGAAEREGVLTPDSVLIESSSGNLAVALSMIAANKGLRFLCVTDPRCNLTTRRLVEALGSKVHVVSEPAEVGGYLGARIAYVERLCASDSRFVWLNQYANPGNWRAHHSTTAPEIATHWPELDVLFVGAGTTGTLMGCARFFRDWHRPVTVVAVDAVGSVAFGGPSGRRMIPGLGTSVRRCSMCPWWTTSSGWRSPTPCGSATGWPAAASCSAAPPARWCAAPRHGWTGTAVTGSPPSRSPPTSVSGTWTRCTNPRGSRRHSDGTSPTPVRG